ncbi:MAG: DNRLRE domain-containing protein [Planctomyces sp.]|nr:DNRLRE domain-containing protein [Planctomyces sp.]
MLSTVTVQLGASEDTTIYDVPSGNVSNGSGEFLVAGGVYNSIGAKRGLVRFDLGSSGIPEGSTIIDAVLTLHATQSIGGASSVGVHRLIDGWGEAASNATGNELSGAAALQFDATWLFNYFDGSAWIQPGGDFTPSASAATTVNAIGPYEWIGGGLVADVQGWLDNPGSNFGWLLKGSEIAGVVKAFESSESPNAVLRPVLEITYEEPSIPGIVEGRKWHDRNADGLRIPEVVSNLQLKYHSGKNYFNDFKGSEYWFRSDLTSAWYFLTPSGELIRWNGQSGKLTGQTVARLDERFWIEPDLLLHSNQTAAEPWMNGFVFELVNSQGSVVATTTSRDIDVDGNGFIDAENERGWYRFENVVPGKYTVREQPIPGWTQSASKTSPEALTAYSLQTNLGLHVSGSLFEDFGGLGEKWLRGSAGWYYIVPTGSLYKWDGKAVSSTRGVQGTLIANPGRSYFLEPALLYAAQNPVLTVSAGLTISNVDFGNFQPAMISGRKWHDVNADGRRNVGGYGTVTVMPQAPAGAPFLNAPWYRLPAVDGEMNIVGETYFYFAGGDVFRWSKATGSVYVTSVWGGIAKTSEAISQAVFAAEPWLNGWTFELLDESGNVIATKTTADVDRNFDGRIDVETERGWYAFENLLPGNYTIREVQQAGWVQTSPARPEYQDLAESLNRTYGFRTTGIDYFNFGARNERWFQGRNNEWYFIIPSGTVFEWDRNSGGVHGPARGKIVAQLSSSFYMNLNLLSTPAGSSVSVTSSQVIETMNFGNHKVIDGLFSSLKDELLQ